MKKYIVTVEFADKNNISKHFKPGDELPAEFEADRLANIVKLGLAKVEDTEGGNVTDIDLTGKAADIASQVKVFTDVEKLKQYLDTEKATENPRKTVVEAIETRLANIVKSN